LPGVDRQTYEIESRVERDHWWFRGRRQILRRLIARLDPPLPPSARVLDIGCGTGANGPVLAESGRFAVGIDASPIPLGLDRERGAAGHAARVRGDAARLPFRDASFDLVVALDVLEHLDDDRAGARELARVIAPGGAAIVFVPALEILWGIQDDVSHHRRRYGRRQLVDVIGAGGLDVVRATFFNTLLFAPILAARLAMRAIRPASLHSENQLSGPWTNAVLARVFGAEARVVDRVSLPVGVSLACIARRPGS